MLNFLLGFLVGSVATVSYLKGQQAKARAGSAGANPLTVGHVDELTSAAEHPDPSTLDLELNAGDGTPSQNSAAASGVIVLPPGTRH